MLERDDAVLSRWLGGQDVRGISRSLKISPRAVRGIITAWSSEVIPDKGTRVARQYARLDRMLAAVLPLACSTSGSVNFKAIAAACKMISLQSLLMGDYQANVALGNTNTIVQVNQLERQTSTDRLEQALNRLIEDQRREATKAVDAEPVDPAPADAEPVT